MKLKAGSIVDRYQVLQVVGEGGMAMVYLVRHQELGTTHAMKVLSKTSSTIERRMLTEGRIQAQLRHPNVVLVSDVIRVNDTPALVMEYIHGCTLRQLLNTRRLSAPEVDVLGQGILRGVLAAHRHKLIHRDLKPANILLCRDDEGGLLPKVTDFGIAKVILDDESSGGTKTGAFMGTPAYMAPEQFRDATDVDVRADVFSLGAILYELCAGRRAFPQEGVVQTYEAIQAQEYAAPVDFHPGLPTRMQRAVKLALDADREARPADVAALLKIWRGEDTGEPYQAPLPDQTWSDGLLETFDELTATNAPPPQAADFKPTPKPAKAIGTTMRQTLVAGGLGFAVVFGLGSAALCGAGYLFIGNRGTAPEPATEAEIDEPSPEVDDPRAETPEGAPGEADDEAGEASDAPDEAPADEAPTPPEPVKPEAEAPAPKVTEAPAPAPEPAPKQAAKPAASSKPAPEPAPEPAGPPPLPPGHAEVSLTGIDRAYLIAGATRHQVPGQVPIGSYTLTVFFAPGQATEVMKLNLTDGQRRTIVCNSQARACR